MKTLAYQIPKEAFPLITSHLETELRNPELAAITKVDFAIFQTPEGELYDKSVLDQLVINWFRIRWSFR